MTVIAHVVLIINLAILVTCASVSMRKTSAGIDEETYVTKVHEVDLDLLKKEEKSVKLENVHKHLVTCVYLSTRKASEEIDKEYKYFTKMYGDRLVDVKLPKNEEKSVKIENVHKHLVTCVYLSTRKASEEIDKVYKCLTKMYGVRLVDATLLKNKEKFATIVKVHKNLVPCLFLFTRKAYEEIDKENKYVTNVYVVGSVTNEQKPTDIDRENKVVTRNYKFLSAAILTNVIRLESVENHSAAKRIKRTKRTGIMNASRCAFGYGKLPSGECAPCLGQNLPGCPEIEYYEDYGDDNNI